MSEMLVLFANKDFCMDYISKSHWSATPIRTAASITLLSVRGGKLGYLYLLYDIIIGESEIRRAVRERMEEKRQMRRTSRSMLRSISSFCVIGQNMRNHSSLSSSCFDLFDSEWGD